MYKVILNYILQYKLRIFIAMICLLFATVLNGASLALLAPFVDKILVAEGTERGDIFEIEEVEQTVEGTQASYVGVLLKAKKTVNIFCNDKSAYILLKFFALILIILIFFKGLFNFLREYLLNGVSFRIVKDIRDDLYAHLHSLSMDYFTKEHVGEIMSRVTNDTTLVQQAVTKGWSEMLFLLANIIVYIFIAFYINYKLAFFAIIFIPCMVFPIIKLGRRLKKITLSSQEILAGLTSILQETISGIKVVKAFAMEGYEIAKFKEETRKFLRMMLKFVKRDAIVSPLLELVGALGGILILLLGGREVLTGAITKGEFLLFLVAVLSLLHPFKKIGKSYNMLQQAIAGFTRIFEIFNVKTNIKEIANPKTLKEIKKVIKYENIDISYDNKNIVVSDVSFEVKVGEVIAFVGSSGSGKTSLLNLLPRFYDPHKGNIYVDGINLKEFSVKSLRKNMGIVTQEVILFNDTILSNIAYGHKRINKKDVIKAAKTANAHDFIMKMPNQYDTVVGEKGTRLSGGERQRIAIARAVLKNPPILILDEATSALDTESEKYVQEAIERLMKGRTVFAIAHRLSTIKHADKIVVLNNNKVAQIGTHEELLKKEGAYKKLYNLQIR
jgi:ATP-binding cassette, subfamily B, bacterial MsbA